VNTTIDPFQKKILVIIPAYNEERSLGSVIDEVKEALPRADIVVVNDGSTDETAKVALAKNVFLVNHDVNLGIGSTVQTGYKLAKIRGYDIAIQVDGDGQHSPDDLRHLVAPILLDETDLVIGSRFLGESIFVSSFPRRLGICLFSLLTFLLTGKPITDPTSGFRAVNKRVIDFFAQTYPSDYPEPEVLVTLYKNSFRWFEIPVTMQARTAGVSSISLKRAIYYMVKVPFAMLIESIRPRGVI